VNKSWPQIGKR